MNIADAIADHARTRPDHPAIEDGERVVSYAELNELVANCAANLQEAGIGAGDSVAVMLTDSVDHIAILYALAKLGAISVSIDTHWGATEREQAVDGFRIQTVISMPGATQLKKATMLNANDIARPSVHGRMIPAKLNVRPSFDANHPMMGVQSSGTTGDSKRFFLSHLDIRSRGEIHSRYLGLGSSDRYFQVPGITFLAGRRRCVMMHYLGATVVINRATKVKELLACFARQGITFTFLTPAHLRALLGSSAGSGPLVPNMKILVSSSPVTHEQRMLARQRLTPNIFEGYATNEIGDIAFAASADQDAFPDSVGRLVDELDVQIVNEDDQQLPAGEVGHIRIRAPYAPESYDKNPEATEQAFRDGWFYPGDLAALNDEGYLFFKGRADDVINNEGAKFYPIEVENALLEHPAIAEAAVFGWPHKQFGEVAVAYLVTRSTVTENEIRAFCRQRLAGYKIPGLVVRVPDLPRNRMGKIVKGKLKEQFGKKIAPRNRFLSRA